jgi:hypothetical protein
MNADGCILAFDLGTSSLKLAVTTARGEIVGSAVERYPLHVLGGGGVEQDPEDCAGWSPGAFRGSGWSHPTPTAASRARSRRCSRAPAGSAAAPIGTARK